jgi:TatD DNase family protein
MHLTDSHAHLDMYPDSLAEVLARAEAAGVRIILAIGIGEGPEEMHRALEIAAEFSGRPATPAIFASAGIHPQEAHRADADALAKLARLAEDERVIAIGEIGLDYYHVDNPVADVQKAAFVAQMQIAATAGKPILIHCRTSELAKPEAKEKFGPADAWEDLLDLLDAHWSPKNRGEIPAGILHCFSGTLRQAQRALDFGFYLSFAGNLTYPRAAGLREVAASAPANRILVETDAPFLAPIPHRGEQNEPALVVHTAECLAALRGLSTEALAALTTANFQHLFPTTSNLEPRTCSILPPWHPTTASM